MKNLKKKIIAIVTLAMFVMTLLPGMAFAGDDIAKTKTVSVKNSTATVNGAAAAANTSELYVTKSDVTITTPFEFNIDVKDAANNDTDQPLKNVYVWAVDQNSGKRIDLFYLEETLPLGQGMTYTDTISEAGTYKIYAGVGASLSEALATDNQLNCYNNTVVVEDVASEVNSIVFQKTKNVSWEGEEFGANTKATLTYAGGVQPNGTLYDPVQLKAWANYVDDEASDASSANREIKIANNNKGITVVDPDTHKVIDTVTTDANGIADVAILAESGTPASEDYKITFTADKGTAELTVKIGQDSSEPIHIKTVDTGKKYVNADKDKQAASLKSVAQFAVTDAKGNFIGADFLEKATIAVLEAPEGVKTNAVKEMLQLKDVSLTSDYVCLDLKDPKTLAEGDYKVRVGLEAGDSADVSFTVAPFGKAVAMKIVEDIQNDTIALGDEVTLGEKTYVGKLVLVDENGMEEDATDATIGYNGSAVEKLTPDSPADAYFTLQTKELEGNEALIGTKIKLSAYDAIHKLTATKEITVVATPGEGVGLEFDTNKGSIKKANTVKASVVDEDGNLVKAAEIGNVVAYVADTSVKDADVKVIPGTLENGVVELTLTSDVATTADIVVAVKDMTDGENKGKIYANTLTYTFADESKPDPKPEEKVLVAMTIGSSDYIVNNGVVAGDAAPFVEDNRTFVPIRALSEAFGAKVDWVEADQTVTIDLGDNEIVMTIGEKAYTVNGVEKTMDVAPEIKDSRTYVPVRFVAEGLGFKVTPTYNTDGTTAGVVFQK